MAYTFDGNNDGIGFGSDASIDGFTQQTICAWVKLGATGIVSTILCKSTPTAAWAFGPFSSDNLRFRRQWSGAVGNWTSSQTLTTALAHVAVTYDGGATGNDPLFYVNGTVGTTGESVAPSGTLSSDATPNMSAGLRSDNLDDYNGQMSALIYDNSIWSAADINRAMWWGTRGGGAKCYYPMLTDAVNRGTATANGTPSGQTALASLPRVERNWGSMMGVGR